MNLVKKGEVRNPTGKNGKAFKVLLEEKGREVLKRDGTKRGYTADRARVEAVYELAMDAGSNACVKANEFIQNRRDGMPTQRIEGDMGGRLEVIVRHVDGMGLELPPNPEDAD